MPVINSLLKKVLACLLCNLIKTIMPEKRTIEAAKHDKREGKSPGTQAGEFVREEMEHIRNGKHGARSAKQAIAIGLSKARCAGVNLKPPKKGRNSKKTWKNAEREYEKGQRHEPVSHTRSRAKEEVLKHEPRRSASHETLLRQAHNAAKHRSLSERSAAARKAAETKEPRERSEAAKKAAATRKQRGH